MKSYYSILSLLTFFSSDIISDSLLYNSPNNHGMVGLINMPTARLYDESSFGVTIYNGTPDQKLTFSSSPYDWMEASFFYTNIENKRYCQVEADPVCDQDYKDKGFNFKIRVKEEDILPAIAIGINDIGGTGLYASEYIVASYGINKTDFHIGLGWGNLNGSKNSFKNPLGYLSDKFYERPKVDDLGGQFQPSRYFSGDTISPFGGITHVFNEKLVLKAEYDATLTDGFINYDKPKTEFSIGFEYNINQNFVIGIAHERGNYTSLRFSYKNNSKISRPRYSYKKANYQKEEDKYTKFIKNIRNNGIGVNKILETETEIGVELTQFSHPNLDLIEEIISRASIDAGIDKEIRKDLRIADLQGVSEYDQEFQDNSKIIYERSPRKRLRSDTGLVFRPFLASREEFFKGSLLIQNNSEYIIRDNFFFSSNLRYSVLDNFDDLNLPPKNTYPEQVRSDVKKYLRNYGDNISIGRAQFDFHATPKKNHHLMLTAGLLEEMFSGAGFEYLYFDQEINYAIGFEVFHVKKRDYQMLFGNLAYENTIGSVNFYFRNYKKIPFDAKISYGEYLAGDEGITFELSRSFKNGTRFGFFATLTDVSSEQFGEGSFDKGVFFNVPVFGNLVNYSWRPLTKDPGAKLNRKHTLHDLLIKFRPIY